MIKNYFLFGSHFYNPLKSLRFPFCFATFTFASEELDECRSEKIDIKGVTLCPVTPALYIRYIYILLLNIFHWLFSLLLYKKTSKSSHSENGI